MDETLINCRDPYCATTCGLWERFVLGPNAKVRPISCSDYKAGIAFPRGAEVCHPDCLIPEISPKRYPLPTGLGVMCRPGTCSPGGCPSAIARANNKALATLQCPCNWFGSECDDEWVPVLEVRKKRSKGHVQETTLVIDKSQWEKVVADHRPGAVVRLAKRDSKGVARDMAAVLATPKTPGELDILTGPPDPSLRPGVRYVAERVRAMASGTVEPAELYVNPVISGFFNKEWTFLMDLLEEKKGKVQHVVICCTGAGLGGALSTVEAIWEQNETQRKEVKKQKVHVHLYYGVRNIGHIPMRERLEKLVLSGAVHLTILASENTEKSASRSNNDITKDFAHVAATKGSALRSRAVDPTRADRIVLGESKSIHVQHAVGLDFLSGGKLQTSGATFENTAFVLCGRAEILDGAPSILDGLCRSSSCDDDICKNVGTQLTFTNV